MYIEVDRKKVLTDGKSDNELRLFPFQIDTHTNYLFCGNIEDEKHIKPALMGFSKGTVTNRLVHFLFYSHILPVGVVNLIKFRMVPN